MKLFWTDAKRRQPRPIFYRTHRSWWQRAQPWLAVVAAGLVVAAAAVGAAALITRLQVTQAQLDTAYLQGLAAGQAMCRSR